MESKCWDFLLEEYCKKLFYLMDCFLETVTDTNLDIDWLLVKVRNHLDKIEKEQAQIKRKRLGSLSNHFHLKGMVFEQFDEYLPYFQFKSDFLLYCSSRCTEFENLCTLVTMNTTSKYPKGMSVSSSCQDDINLSDALTKSDKSNDSLDSTGNRSEFGTQINDHQDINAASYIKVRW